MTSEKPIYKKEYEHVERVDESVWLGNDTPIMESDFTFVFNLVLIDSSPDLQGLSRLPHDFNGQNFFDD